MNSKYISLTGEFAAAATTATTTATVTATVVVVKDQ